MKTELLARLRAHLATMDCTCSVENGEINAGLTATELSKGVNVRWDFDAENHGKGFSDGLTHDVGHEMDNMLKREERWELQYTRY